MKADTQEESKKEKAKENDVFLKSVENHIQERLQTDPLNMPHPV